MCVWGIRTLAASVDALLGEVGSPFHGCSWLTLGSCSYASPCRASVGRCVTPVPFASRFTVGGGRMPGVSDTAQEPRRHTVAPAPDGCQCGVRARTMDSSTPYIWTYRILKCPIAPEDHPWYIPEFASTVRRGAGICGWSGKGIIMIEREQVCVAPPVWLHCCSRG